MKPSNLHFMQGANSCGSREDEEEKNDTLSGPVLESDFFTENVSAAANEKCAAPGDAHDRAGFRQERKKESE
jgi:hypothetical protein